MQSKIIKAAVEEYLFKPLGEMSEEEAVGRHAAIRGMMIRLGLYTEFNAALNEME
jgi:hypothetical protein